MSVINDMLTQLDRRSAPPVTVGGAVVAAPLQASWRNALWKWLVLLAAATALLCAALFGGWTDKLLAGPGARVPRPVSMGAGNEGAPPAAVESVASSPSPATAPADMVHAEAAPPRIATQPPLPARVAPSPPPALASTAAPPPATAVAGAPNPVPPQTANPHAGRPSPAAPLPAPATQAVASTVSPVAMPTVIPPAAKPEPAAPEAVPGEASIDKKLAPPNPAQRAEQLYRQAGELAAGGHGTQSIDKALEALRADPSHAAARQLAAVLLVEKGRLDEAAAVLRDGLARTPAQPQLSYLLARLKVEAGDTAGALALLQASEGLSAEGFALRAALLVRQGMYGEALPSYEASLRRNPDTATTWLGLAVALEAQGRADQARQAFARAQEVGALRGGLNAELQTYIAQKLSATR